MDVGWDVTVVCGRCGVACQIWKRLMTIGDGKQKHKLKKELYFVFFEELHAFYGDGSQTKEEITDAIEVGTNRRRGRVA